MEWQIVVAVALMVPVLLIPVAFVWYLNIGGIYAAVKEARQRRAVRKQAESLERSFVKVTNSDGK